MSGSWEIIKDEGPIVALAVHHGHEMSSGLLKMLEPVIEEREREEDPFTGYFAEAVPTRVVFHSSRFEFDVNRKREEAVYLTSQASWGLKLWKFPPPAEVIEGTLKEYDRFYEELFELLTEKVNKYDKVFVYDIHSYNHFRNGPGGEQADPAVNPDINFGTKNLNRVYWQDMVEHLIEYFSNYNYLSRKLSVKENVKFTGGYVTRWISDNFHNKVCSIAVEFKKFFMNEWTREADHHQLELIKEMLKGSLPLINHELSLLRDESRKKAAG